MAALELKIPPPIVAAIILLVVWLGARLTPTYGIELTTGARLVAAGLLGIAGLAFDVAGWLAFRRARTTINPLAPERSSALVTSGVYWLTRNPMYVGMAFLLTACAVWIAHPLALFAPILFAAIITRLQIRPEERILRQKFGPEFDAYARATPRWLVI